MRNSALMWNVRREIWENRATYIAPLAAAVIFLTGYSVSLMVNTAGQATSGEPFTYASVVMMAVGIVVGVFYCLDAFYSERKDRSILFWKSLPVSDGMTVLSKALIPIVVIPLITTAVIIALHMVMLAMGSAALLVRGLPVSELWRQVAPVSTAVDLVQHMLVIHGLWYSPIFAWLLLSSAWARRAPFLWAGIPLLAIAVVERLVMGSTGFVDALKFRVITGPMNAAQSSDPMAHVNVMAYLGNAAFWAGLVTAAVFLVITTRVRRRAGPF
jgi:ABC-2 type transport system permease protein